MKQCICIFIFVCLLTACGKYEQEDYGNEYILDKDAQTFSAAKDTVFTEQGFYTIADFERIDFIDSKTSQSIPVCAKPNCKHRDDSCNAFFHHPQEIQTYDGMLYVVAGGSEQGTMSLYRFSMDGSERVELKSLFAYEEEDASCSLELVIHRGYGYMVTNWIQEDRKERTQKLYRISLDSEEEMEEIYEFKGYTPLIHIIQGDKNQLYFTAERYLDEDLKEYETKSFHLDILSGTITELAIPNGYGLVAAKNGKAYYYNSSDKDLYSINEDGTDQKKVFEWTYDKMNIYMDQDHLYLDNENYIEENNLSYEERKLIVIDYDGNKVCEFSDLGDKGVLWSNQKQLLIQYLVQDSDETRYELLDLKR